MSTVRTHPHPQQMSEEAYREFALTDPSGRWELVQGRLRERVGMTVAHGGVMAYLFGMLHEQLDRAEYRLRSQHARLRVSADTYYVPDIAVIPTAMERTLAANDLDAYPDPLPLVIEVWSPSTGNYDVNEKIPGYQQRGDLEIWRIHPYERSLTTWRRQPDGGYVQTVHRGGIARPELPPNVAIDLDELFTP